MVNRNIHLTPEERMLLQGVHARELQLKPLVDQLNDDSQYVARKIAERNGLPLHRLAFNGALGSVTVTDGAAIDADPDQSPDDRP